MIPFRRRTFPKAGLPPGSLVYVGPPRAGTVRIVQAAYDGSRYEEKEVPSPSELESGEGREGVNWIHVLGLHDPAVVEAVGRCRRLHPLLLEDVLDTAQRTKVEEYEDMLFIVLKAFESQGDGFRVSMEQVSIVLGPRFVISFQEGEKDLFQSIRKRLGRSKNRLRSKGADYLAYALMDSLVDQYLSTLESLTDWTESLEEEIATEPSQDTLRKIHQLKREILLLRRCVWPLREFIGRLERTRHPLVEEGTRIYFRDLYDHAIQVSEGVETLWEMTSGLMDVYLSTVSNRMNQVMKTLTIIATLFIPLTFIAGIYGMNFEYMPELEWRWGYPLIWAVMLGVAALLLLFFRSRKWL